MSERDTAEGVRAIRKALGSPLTEIHDHTLAMLDRYAALLERAERPASDVERLVRDVREASHRHQAGETTSEVCDEAYAVALTAVRALAARPDVERAREGWREIFVRQLASTGFDIKQRALIVQRLNWSMRFVERLNSDYGAFDAEPRPSKGASEDDWAEPYGDTMRDMTTDERVSYNNFLRSVSRPPAPADAMRMVHAAQTDSTGTSAHLPDDFAVALRRIYLDAELGSGSWVDEAATEHARRMAVVERERDEARREVERLRAAFFKGVES